MSSPNTPLLETRELILGGNTPLEVGTHHLDVERLALWNEAGALLTAFRDERRIVEGTLLLRGQDPKNLLASGEAAYVPETLPLSPSTKVKEALVLSARLLGLGRSDAEYALERCRLLAHGNRRLGELTPLQSRLLTLAHGLCGNPKILLLENLYVDLDDADAEVLQALLDIELEERSYIVAASVRDPESRSLALATDQVLTAAGHQILPPIRPEQLMADGYWVTCNGDVRLLADHLTELGAQVTRSPRSTVLLARKASGSALYQAAHSLGLAVIELTPTGSSADPPSVVLKAPRDQE